MYMYMYIRLSPCPGSLNGTVGSCLFFGDGVLLAERETPCGRSTRTPPVLQLKHTNRRSYVNHTMSFLGIVQARESTTCIRKR